MPNPELKNMRFVEQRPTEQRRTRQPRNGNQRSQKFGPRFIPTYFHCEELGHIRPRCHKFLNLNRNMNFSENKIRSLLVRLTSLMR